MSKPKRAADTSNLEQHLASAEESAREGHAHDLTLRAFTKGWTTRFSQDIIDELVIPHRTFMRRKQKRENLNAAETDRALRLARIVLNAERVFHGRERADQWLATPNAKFSNQTPYSLLKTEVGCHMIDETLLQIEHGVYA